MNDGYKAPQSTAWHEPKQIDEGGAKEKCCELPVAVAGDAELMHDHLGTGNINESTCGDAAENDIVDISSVSNSHANSNANRSCGREDGNQLDTKFFVLWEGSGECNAERATGSSLVNENGDYDVDNILFFRC